MLEQWVFKGKIIYVYAGNKFDVVVDVGFRFKGTQFVTLEGISLPGLRSSSEQERKVAQVAKDFAMAKFLGQECIIETFKDLSKPGYTANIYFQETKRFDKEAVVDIDGISLVDAGKAIEGLMSRLKSMESGQ